MFYALPARKGFEPRTLKPRNTGEIRVPDFKGFVLVESHVHVIPQRPNSPQGCSNTNVSSLYCILICLCDVQDRNDNAPADMA